MSVSISWSKHVSLGMANFLTIQPSIEAVNDQGRDEAAKKINNLVFGETPPQQFAAIDSDNVAFFISSQNLCFFFCQEDEKY